MQITQRRIQLFCKHNDLCLASLYIDSDLLFPCYLIYKHQKHYDRIYHDKPEGEVALEESPDAR
jgi:hypothetical protein